METHGSNSHQAGGALEIVDDHSILNFQVPAKRIHDGPDVTFFLTSYAYRDIMTFVLQLNRSMLPRKLDEADSARTRTWELSAEADPSFSRPVLKLRELLMKLQSFIEEVPPDTGPRRFGNVSFRKWCQLVESRIDQMLETYLETRISHRKSTEEPHSHDPRQDDAPSDEEKPTTANDELKTYLIGSFGSPQRLDYGTGHELSFLAFLAGLWKLGWFAKSENGSEERNIVLGVFELYLNLIRQLIKIYTLEPAGTHGVWGLDDNSFLPFIFGSAQLAPAISETDQTPTEGSIANAPEPSSVTKPNVVERERKRNMYFSAISFIYDVKRGPFWEHSPMLYDISGIKDGWGKINKGMLKMYNAEVLAKFPVVQHFPFGSLFRWENDPNALPPPSTTHSNSQPLRNPAQPAQNGPGKMDGQATEAPWAATTPKPPVGMVDGVTKAPWASKQPPPPPSGFRTATRVPLARQNHGPGPTHGRLPTRTPWTGRGGSDANRS